MNDPRTKHRQRIVAALATVALLTTVPRLLAAGKAEPAIPLTDHGKELLAKYAELLKAAQAEVTRSLPVVSEQRKIALQQARAALKKGEAEASSAQEPLAKVKEGEALVAHAKGKWIGGAEKGIAEAAAARKNATTDAQRAAAQQDLAKWQANKEEGLEALKQRQEALDKA